MLPSNDQTIPFYAGSIGSWQFTLSRRPLGVLELADRYDQIAPRWSRLTRHLGYPRAYEYLWQQFLDEAYPMPSDYPRRILDCGVGTGSFSLAFARASTKPARIDAVDVSDEMIRQARQHLQQAGLKVAFKRADICALPYPENQFDLVMAAHVLEHLPDPVIALKEIRRVLKPGGWLVVCLTRTSIFGRYIQLKWRTHRLNYEKSESWLNAAGLNIHHMNLDSTGFFRQSSLTCIGRKPA